MSDMTVNCSLGAAAVAALALRQDSKEFETHALTEVRFLENGDWTFNVCVVAECDDRGSQRYGTITVSSSHAQGNAVQIALASKPAGQPDYLDSSWLENVKTAFQKRVLRQDTEPDVSFRNVLAAVLDGMPREYLGTTVELECDSKKSCRMSSRKPAVIVAVHLLPHAGLTNAPRPSRPLHYWLASVQGFGVGTSGAVTQCQNAVQAKLQEVLDASRSLGEEMVDNVTQIRWSTI